MPSEYAPSLGGGTVTLADRTRSSSESALSSTSSSASLTLSQNTHHSPRTGSVTTPPTSSEAPHSQSPSQPSPDEVGDAESDGDEEQEWEDIEDEPPGLSALSDSLGISWDDIASGQPIMVYTADGSVRSGPSESASENEDGNRDYATDGEFDAIIREATNTVDQGDPSNSTTTSEVNVTQGSRPRSLLQQALIRNAEQSRLVRAKRPPSMAAGSATALARSSHRHEHSTRGISGHAISRPRLNRSDRNTYGSGVRADRLFQMVRDQEEQEAQENQGIQGNQA
ncbi:hypothetical protein I317_03358 [Kwoniella heveanensis CBS 569]|nr:hypothetical protein I317_03358 [Kwoniella heveanensis CBS 569]